MQSLVRAGQVMLWISITLMHYGNMKQ